MIDHIVIGAPDLNLGIDFVFEKTKLEAIYGGKHIDWNTENALLSLGSATYLEIIAPQPGLKSKPPFDMLSSLDQPGIITWAAGTQDIIAVAKSLNLLNVDHSGVIFGSRIKVDGSQLKWKILFPANNFEGIFPFFIQWDKETTHPALNIPPGLSLQHMFLYHPQADRINKLFENLNMVERCTFFLKSKLEIVLGDPSGMVIL